MADESPREEQEATQAAQATQQLEDKEEEDEGNLALDEEDAAPQATQAVIATQQIDEDDGKQAEEDADDDNDEDAAPKDEDDEDDDFQGEEEDEDEEKKAKKSKKQSKKNKDAADAGEKKKRKKRSKKSDGEDGEKPPAKKRKKSKLDDLDAAFEANDEEDAITQPKSSSSNDASSSSRGKKDLDDFDKMMLPLKSRNRRSDADDLGFDAEASNIATDLIDRMRTAARQDLDSIKQGKPATAKLALLSSVVERASKPIVQIALIEKGFLDVLSQWLEPVVKGSLPNINLRTEILKILLELPVKGDVAKLSNKESFDSGIDIDHLKGGIGKNVRILSAHPQETSDNAKRASAIIDKWTRLIYGRSENYKESSLPQESPKRRVPKQPVKEEEDLRPSLRARVPRAEGYDFSIRPVSKVSLAAKQKQDKDSDSVQKRLSKKFLDMKKKK